MVERRRFDVVLVTQGPPPYGEDSWAGTVESILLNEIKGVDEANVIEVEIVHE